MLHCYTTVTSSVFLFTPGPERIFSTSNFIISPQGSLNSCWRFFELSFLKCDCLRYKIPESQNVSLKKTGEKHKTPLRTILCVISILLSLSLSLFQSPPLSLINYRNHNQAKQEKLYPTISVWHRPGTAILRRVPLPTKQCLMDLKERG